MEKGTVKWFTMPKGLVSSALKAAAKIFSLLFHHSDGWLQNAKSWTIRSVDVHQGPKGNHASVIVPVEVERQSHSSSVSLCTS